VRVASFRILATIAAREATPSEGRIAADGSDDHGVSRAIIAAHETVLRLAARFSTGLGGYEQLSELLALGRNRGRAWSSWSRTVRRAVEECRHALQVTEGGLLECWRDLVERRDYRRTGARSERAEARPKEPLEERGVPPVHALHTELNGSVFGGPARCVVLRALGRDSARRSRAARKRGRFDH